MFMSDILFSIIIPTYNSRSYICETIDSVLTQTYESYEILLIDDCSNDNIFEEIKLKYPKSNIKTFSNNSKHGPNFSRNFGLQNAVGDYIIFLDSDDLLSNDALRVLNQKLKNSNVDFIYFGFEFISETNKILGKHYFPSGQFSNTTLIEKYFTGEITTVCWNKVYSSSFLKENNISFIPDLIHGRDSIFILNCCLRAQKVLFIKDVLYYSTVRANSFSRKFTINNLKSIIANLSVVKRISGDWNIDFKLVDLYEAKHIRYILLVASFRLSFSDYFKGLKLFFECKKIQVLFKYHVLSGNSFLKNIVSVIVCIPFLILPLSWFLNKIKIRPY